MSEITVNAIHTINHVIPDVLYELGKTEEDALFKNCISIGQNKKGIDWLELHGLSDLIDFLLINDKFDLAKLVAQFRINENKKMEERINMFNSSRSTINGSGVAPGWNLRPSGIY